VTVFDNGFSWLPNPPIIVGAQFGPLPPGLYVLDAFVDANWAPSYYPRTIAKDVAFEILAPPQVPTLDFEWRLTLSAILALLGIASLRVARRPFNS
jgi:hypothetical protein